MRSEAADADLIEFWQEKITLLRTVSQKQQFYEYPVVVKQYRLE